VLVRFMFADKSVINNITLSTGDSYQIELDTNLDDITYTSLSAGVIVNEKGFLTVTRPGMHVVKIESPNCAIPLTLMISATANLM